MSATATASSAPAAGWYPDPHAAEDRLRWWDGAAWTNFTTDPPDPEPEPEPPHPFADMVADVQDADVPVDDEGLDDLEPIEFSWSDPADLFEVTVAEPEAASGPFVFRARPLDAPVGEIPEPALEVPALPVYESPLATIASPVSVRVQVPVRVEVPVAAEAPEAEPEPDPVDEAAAPEATPRRRRALAGTSAVIAVAATAAMATNVLSGNGDTSPSRAGAAGGPALPAAERACLKEWNTTASGGAAQLRVTLGQFQGANAKIARVAPLPGTVMAPDSCALTVYDPATDTRAVFVSGVRDQVGYLDVTSYPRAAQYGAPRSADQANVAIKADGSIRAL